MLRGGGSKAATTRVKSKVVKALNYSSSEKELDPTKNALNAPSNITKTNKRENESKISQAKR